MSEAQPQLVLASGSTRRLALLRQIGIVPGFLMPANIEEGQERGETPRMQAERLARTKVAFARRLCNARGVDPDALILGADTVVACGRLSLPKATTRQEAQACIERLSGRTHRVYTGICVCARGDVYRQRLVETRVRFKSLSKAETGDYLACGEWQEMAGGYAIQGLAGAFVVKLVGSYSNVVGLPLFETANLLGGFGYRTRAAWANIDALDLQEIPAPEA